MAALSRPTQRQQPADNPMGSDNRNRRLNTGLGCQLPGSQHRRPLDETGEREPHQPSRATGGFPGTEGVYTEGKPNSKMDNVMAIAYVNKMGGTHSSTISDLVIEIWKWCIARSIRIHAEHLPGKDNVRAGPLP